MKKENQTNEGLQACVGMVGFIMSRADFTKTLPISSVEDVAQTVLKIAKKSKEKKILIRILWGFAMEKYPSVIYNLHCDALVDIIIDALHAKQSSVVVYESLRLLLFLLKSIGATVVEKSIDFYPEVFPQMFHTAPRIRKLALSCTRLILEQPDMLEVLHGIVETFVKEIINTYSPSLVKLVNDETYDALTIWQVCIKMLGKTLHSGTTLINALLQVIEKAFKSNVSIVRVEAFNCWSCLIDNFSLDKALLTSNKRLKLIIAPFMANNAKTEDIILSKLAAWWHFICCLDEKATQNFDLVVLPFLNFCFKSQGTLSSTSPKAGGLALKNLALASPSVSAKISDAAKTKTIFVFHQLLAGNSSNIRELLPCSFPSLENTIITDVLFSKHHQLLSQCYKEVLKHISSLNSHEDLVITISEAFLKFMSVFLNKSNVREGSEVLKEIISSVTDLAGDCEMDSSTSVVVLDSIWCLVCGSQKMPLSVLHSRQYQSGCSFGAGSVMRGTLAFNFISILLQDPLLHTAASHHR